MPGRRYLSFLGNGHLSTARQRQLLWEEHEAHYQWLQREEKLIRTELSRLNGESAQLETQRVQLQSATDSHSADGQPPPSCHTFMDTLQQRCSAFEAAVNRYKLRLRRWNQERDRFNAIDRIISRP